MKENQISKVMGAKNYASKSVKLLAFLFSICTFYIAGCGKDDVRQSVNTSGAKAKQTTSAAQPLPGGKNYFTVTYGNLDNTGTSWVRIAQWTFTASTGTIAATYSNWDSNNRIGKTAINSHTCTMPIPGGQKTATCSVYAPTGWLAGSHSSVPGSWTGTYTFDNTTGILQINWNNGHNETWKVTIPSSKLARVVFQASPGSSYGITHGRGYGSTRPFTGTGNYIPVTSVPRVAYAGWRVIVNQPGSGGNPVPSPTQANVWRTDAVDLSTYTSSSSGGVLHWRNPDDGSCTGGCGSGTYGGVICHLGGNNTSRKMLWTGFCSCLTSNANYPCYAGSIHPNAMQQILNDDGALVGFVGLEAQQEPVYTVGYQFQLRDWILPGLNTSSWNP